MKSTKIRNSFLLVLTAFIWGVAFVAQSEGGTAVGPYSFNCIRSLVGSAFLLPVICFLDKTGLSKNRPVTRQDRKTLIIGGVSCGTALCIASNLQQLGIYLGTPVGKAGFLTACYVVVVPILGIFFKRKCTWNIWIGVFLTLIGLYLLCMSGSFRLQFSDTLLIICSVCFSIQIMLIDHFTPMVDGVRMSCIQFLTCGCLSTIPMFFIDMKHSIAGIINWAPVLTTWDAWLPILYAGCLSSGVAYTLQIIGQKGVHPTVASLLMSLESVFSVLAGWLLLNQYLGSRELAGCALIFAAIILAQIPVKSRKH